MISPCFACGLVFLIVGILVIIGLIITTCVLANQSKIGSMLASHVVVNEEEVILPIFAAAVPLPDVESLNTNVEDGRRSTLVERNQQKCQDIQARRQEMDVAVEPDHDPIPSRDDAEYQGEYFAETDDQYQYVPAVRFLGPSPLSMIATPKVQESRETHNNFVLLESLSSLDTEKKDFISDLNNFVRLDAIETNVTVPEAKIDSPIIIGTYNLRVDRDPAPHRWSDRVSHVLKNMQQSNASIFGLQEVEPRYLMDLAAKFPHMKILGAWRDESRTEGCHVMYDKNKWTLIEYKTYALGGSQARPCETATCGQGKTCFKSLGCDKHQRVMTHLALKSVERANGTIIDLLNTHMPLKQNLQVACAEQIAIFAQDVIKRRPDTIVVVTGDMNTHHDPFELNTATKVFQDAGFKDSMNWQDLPTFGPMQLFSSLKADSHKLDYVLIKQGPLFKSTGLFSGSIVNFTYGPQSLRPSDHQLCIARIE